MDGREHSLVPQWLKSSGSVSKVDKVNSQLKSSPDSDHITYTVYRRSSSSKGSGFSRSYSSSSGRSQYNRDWDKDIDKFFGNDKLFHGEYNHDHSDYVDRILSSRFEKDLVRRSRSMNSGRWREDWSPRTSSDVSNPQKNNRKSDGMVSGVTGTMHKTVFDEEFPLLGAEDKHGSFESGRVLSSSSSTYSLPSSTSSVIVSNGLSSTLDETPPMTIGGNITAVTMHQHTDSASTSSIAPGKVSLSMAETVAQGPSRLHTPPQLSVDTQKLEELALKQSRLLIPMTPSTPRSLVASPSEKSKVKTGQQQYPFSYSRSPGNYDMQKIGFGNSRNVSVSRELNGVTLATKENWSPSRSRVVLIPTGATASASMSSSPRVSSNNSTPSAWTTLEKRPTIQTQSRSDFFKNLSRKGSSKDPCSGDNPSGMPPSLETSQVGSAQCSLNSSTDEHNRVVTENGSTGCKSSSFSSNGEQQSSTHPVLYLDEEIAFLRSLGWEESDGEDEGLTEEEIQEFYEKYLRLQS